MKELNVIAIVDLKDLDGNILLVKNHLYKALSEIQCNRIAVMTEQGKRFLSSCLFTVVE